MDFLNVSVLVSDLEIDTMHFHGFSRVDLAKENPQKCRYINYLCTADSTSVGGYSFLREKNIICHFKGLFIKIKKFKISMKNPHAEMAD